MNSFRQGDTGRLLLELINVRRVELTFVTNDSVENERQVRNGSRPREGVRASSSVIT